MRQQLIAQQKFSYARRALKAGDVFEADGNDAGILILLGRARQYQTEAGDENSLSAELVPTEATAPQKRRYRRRDLRAES